MKQVKMDILRSVRENLLDLMVDGEVFVHEFEVYPFDHNITDYSSPKFYMTNRQLFFTYDEIIEVYDLLNLKFEIYGDDPKFTVWQQWMEGKFYYAYGQEGKLIDLKNADYYTHLAITEPQQVPKEFAYRSGMEIGKAYQSWAMAQQMINSKNNLPEDPRIQEMLLNNFNKFNGRTIVVYVVIFIVYVVLTRLFEFLPDIVGTIFNVIFAIITGFVGVWLYKTLGKNLDAFGTVYNSYRQNHQQNEPQNPTPQAESIVDPRVVNSNSTSSATPVVEALNSERQMSQTFQN